MKKNRQELIQYLSKFITHRRLHRIETVLNNRSKSLVLVLEDIYDPHNANAVIRSCDAFGIQDLHVIENINAFRPSEKVSSGSHHWVSIHRYTSNPNAKKNTLEKMPQTIKCLTRLKKEGYTICATTPHAPVVSLGQYQPQGKVALLLGNEHSGLSDTALQMAHMRLAISMEGFCESLNLSVSAAVFMHTLKEKLMSASLWDRLPENEKEPLKLEWISRSLKRAEQYEKDFYVKKN